MQKEHIQELHQKYKDIWMVRQDTILRSHNAKVSELQELCQAKGQVIAENTTNVTALQAQVAQLLAQLAAHGVQPIVDSPDAFVTEVPSLVVDLAGVNHDIVPGLSQDEKAARQTHADTVRSDPAEHDCSTVSTTALAKGKGKGKTDNGGLY
jgi:hypothetical protein